MTDQTTTPAVHAMQDEWPNGRTPCCGKTTDQIAVGIRFTTRAAEVTCPNVVNHPAMMAARGEAATEPEWLTGLGETMTAELTGTSGTIGESVHTAVRVASYYIHQLHAELAAEKRKVAELEELTKAKMPASAPVVREVPAGEAREGDTVTLSKQGRVVEVRLGSLGVEFTDFPGAISTVLRDDPAVTVTRPVSPLPDQPGAVIRATSCMFEGVRVLERLDKVKYQAGCWAVPGEAGFWDGADLDLIEVLYLPADAGAPEGAK